MKPLFDEGDLEGDTVAANRLLTAFAKGVDDMGGVPVSVVYVFISAVLDRLRIEGGVDLGAQMQVLGALAEHVYIEKSH